MKTPARSRILGKKARALLFALLSGLTVFAAEQVIEHFARQNILEQERNAVLNQLSTLRARLEGVINANLFLIHGLTAVIESRPDIDQAGLNAIAHGLVDDRHALREIGVAPNLVLSLIYPLQDNEAALGLDYRTHPTQREAALRARESGKTVVAGPLTLKQGGVAIIVREPVFLLPAQPNGTRRFWGLVSAVIDIETLYQMAGLREPDLGLRLALRGTDGTGSNGPVFFGDAKLFDEQPVTSDITLPGGFWQIAAIPSNGWKQANASINLIRLMGLLATLMASLLSYRLTRNTQKLASNNARLRTLLNTIPDLVWMKDAHGVYLACNHRFEEFFGASEAAIKGKTDYDFVTADLADFYLETDQAAIATGGPSTNEEWATFASDAHRELLETIKSPVYDNNGNLLGVLGIARDITERKSAELALRQQKEILNRTGRLAKVGGWEFDAATQRGSWADETARIYDLEPGQETGVAYDLSFFQGESRRRLEQALCNAVETGQPYDLELQLTSAKGVEKWVRTIGLPVLEAGKVVRVEGAIQDISVRKHAEIQARQGELVLDSVFKALPDLFFLLDPDGVIRDYRAQQDNDLYAPPETFLNKRMQDVLPTEAGELFQCMLARISGQGGLIAYEYDLPFPDGPQHFETRLTRLPDSAQFIAVVRNITSQYQDRLALISSEIRYRQLFEQNPAPVLVYKKDDLRLLAVNEAFVNHYGYSQDEIQSLLLTDLYPSEDRPRIVELAATLSGLAYVGEWRHLKKDGNRILIEARSHDLPFEGHAARIAVITDITERKRAEQAVRDSETRYRLLLEMAPFPAMISRLKDGLVLYRNHRAEIQFETQPEPGIGLNALSFYVDPENRARLIEQLQNKGHVDDFEVLMQNINERRFWAVINASLIEFDHEQAIFIAVNDITERKQAEAALREQEEFFRMIAENIGDMVAVLDPQGRRLYNSPSYRSLLGEPETLKGSDSFAEIHPDDREEVRQVFYETVRSGIGHRVYFRFVLSDGAVRNIESQGGVIRGADGKVKQVVVVSRDITERKAAEEKIRQLNTELEEKVRQRTAKLEMLNKELESFTYSVSHDLKAPLRGIDGYSRLLLQDHAAQLNEEGRQFLFNVRNGAQQMSQLIDDLLAYSRLERQVLESTAVSLGEVAQLTLAERKEELSERGVLLVVNIPDTAVRADRNGLVMVLRNLLDNALKFTRTATQPAIELGGRLEADRCILWVKDNGIGFNMKFHDQIFEIFHRLQRSEDYPGTGVGLAIVRKAMQRMNGRVWAESEAGQGATFYLELLL